MYQRTKGGERNMYLVVKQQLKHLSKTEYKILKELCHISKNLKNQALYEIRQKFFQDKSYLKYSDVNQILKASENYKVLQSNMAQQILRKVDAEFKSFFGSLKSKNVNHRVSIPHYLPKDGYNQLIIQQISINGDKFQFPYSREYGKSHDKFYIKIPSVLIGKTVKEIKITPKHNARFFEISYTYEVEDIKKEELDKTKALAIDIGINNFCTCATSDGNTFIIDGRKLKSYNQWYNKENARLQCIKDKQKFGKALTSKQSKLLKKRENRMRDYLGKTAKKIINYCLEHNVGNIVFGKNKGFQQNSSIGKVNNQNFTQMPFFQLEQKIKYQCEIYEINFVEQEESYTSKASFWDKDDIPVYNAENPKQYTFSGKRIKRRLYQTSDGKTLNADVNGALNILRKSNVVSLTGLYSRGELNTPVRIRIA